MSDERAPAGILVPLDGSPLAEQALPYARALLAPGAALILLEVVAEPESVAGLWGQNFVTADEMGQLTKRLAIDDLKRAEATLGERRPTTRLEVAVGDAAAQILRVADAAGVESIAMSTGGRRAFGRLVFGSVADRVARNSPKPVLLVRPGDGEPPSPPIRRLVVPLDGSMMATEALPVVATLATRLKVAVRLVAAVDAHRIAIEVAPLAAVDPTIGQTIVDRLRADAETTLGEARDWLGRQGVRADLEVVTGAPAQTIADATREGDLIVMTSHGRGGALRWLLGSVAEKLVREAPVPVMLVPVAARRAAAAAD
ncbi:MAG: universal stress protein [Thermomicrobiales bacterium]|nr:universal stress protein [Thermomicrobiales bacterium]